MGYDKVYVSNDEEETVSTGKNLSQVLREQMKTQGRRFWANDNVSEYMSDAVKDKLIDEATV
jgi:hypothetical protein